jgi:hypothetical protein
MHRILRSSASGLLVYQSGFGIKIRIHIEVKHWILLQGSDKPSHKHWPQVRVGALCHHVFLYFLFQKKEWSNLCLCSQGAITLSNPPGKSHLADPCMHNGSFRDGPCKSSKYAQRLNALIVTIASPSVHVTFQRRALFLSPQL